MKRVLVALGFIFLPWFSIQAEVTVPYLIDEKPEVLFGDSAEIVATTTYKGLENYVANYVNNYLHITFTYTHNQCCLAAYPPSLYVTSSYPVSTTTLAVRENANIFPLASQPVHLTGLYFYDIQFDNAGYTAIVTASSTEIVNFHKDISNIATSTDFVALANHYPKQDPVTGYSMAFTPLPIYEAPVASDVTTTPVIVVPGIMGTKLNQGVSLVWPDTIRLALSQTDDFLNILKLDSEGNDENGEIMAGEITKSLNNADYWNGLFLMLGGSVNEFPYDWRLDIQNSVLALKNRIDEVKNSNGVDKLNIVAHSMGGLIVKKYLKDYGGTSVNKFIDIATPHTGSPAAYKTLMYGENLGVSKFFGLVGINQNIIKSISQNMPSVYELLPSQDYFNDGDPDYRYYVANLANGTYKYDFNGTKGYLNANGRNGGLIERGGAFHQEIDNLNPADYGVETYNIVGCGTPTIGQFYLLDDSTDHPIYNIKMINGDGTVPLKSAEALQASTTYYVKNATHALMPSLSGVKELVTGLLNASGTPVDISSYSNLSFSSSGCGLSSGKIVSFHSPIELHVYDQSGNHAGPDSNGDLENNISGVYYETIGDNKFAFLSDGTDYRVSGKATGSGSFDVRIQEIVNGEVATTTVFTNIPLTTTTQAMLSIGSTTPSQIFLDNDNNGTFEESAEISTQVSGLLEGTGKLFSVAATEDTGGKARKLAAATTSITAQTTSTPVLKTSTTTVAIKAKLQPAVHLSNPSSTAQKTMKYENTAVVYKSAGQKFGGLIKRIWEWVRGRLR